MATTVVHTIKASGGDYTSLASWEAAEQRNLLTLDEIEVAECYGFIDTTATSISGWTTGINNYIIVRAHPSAKATIPMTTDGSRYLLRVSVGSVSALNIQPEYTKIYDIQVETTANAANTNCFFPTSNTTFRNCVARGNTTSEAGSCWFSQGQSNIRLQNCIGIMTAGGGVPLGFARVFAHDTANVQYDNCAAIIAGQNRTGFRLGGSQVNGIILRNCLSINLTHTRGAFNTGASGIGITAIDLVKSTNNISNDATAFGTNAKANQPVIFANSSIGDYHLDWMDPVAQRSGVDLSASDTGSFNDDFDGNTRTTPWHVGPLKVINSPNGIQLGPVGNSNIRLSSTGTSPITIR